MTEQSESNTEIEEEAPQGFIEVPIPQDPRKDFYGMYMDIVGVVGDEDRAEDIMAKQLQSPLEKLIVNLYDNRDKIEVLDDG